MEIILPLDRSFIDYKELIIKAVEKISVCENRPLDQIINDLLLPPSDVIRFRVENKRTDLGLISFNEGFTLLENAKKSLFSTACDLINPTQYHKRMSYKPAQQFIDSCFLGQTERGSFIASVVCPFINHTIDESPHQLSLFNTEDELYFSFTRQVTKKYMMTLHRLKNAIESGNHKEIEQPENFDFVSENFIESIVDLGEYGDQDLIEISTSWSSITKDIPEISSKICFTRDHIPPMESIINRLKPQDEGKFGNFIGKVSKAQADPNPENRTEGEIVFDFIGDENKVVKSKVFLDNQSFSKALEAFDKGLNVKVSGTLKSFGKTKTIENPIFQILD